MYNIEVHNRVIQQVQVFYRLGIWRNDDESSVIRKLGCKLIYFILHACFVLSTLIAAFSSGDKNESVFLFAGGITNLVVSLRLVYILWKEDEIRSFVLDIGTHSVADNEEFKNINDKVSNLTKFSSNFILLVMVAAVMAFSLPIFTSHRILYFNVWFPLDWKNNEISFWIAHGFLSPGVAFTCIGVSLNQILWYLMMNCAIKYQILGNQFRNITPKKSSNKKRKFSAEEKQKLFFDELIGLIKTHQNIQETINRFKACFANLFFAQITTSGICICGSVYALAFGNHRENFTQTTVEVILMLYNIFDIFMIMYFGNEIKLASDRLSYCLFESNWIEQSKSCKKCIIILTEVLKQPHELVIGVLYPLTLETFMSIIDFAYSMFNILQNLD